ncbi:MAG: AraC family transcriptional regulator [Rhodobiaceae bacterium]|jgi:AraC-like DNA-binding protein|nr:HTH-type transcriptional activator RhaS [Rhodobiaceae bacterium]MCR9241351.1 AraC family transcriptional regulator [Rhodobiaceae bacterium]
MKDWSGRLLLGRGWAIYNGPVGDGEYHRHSALQICISGKSDLVLDLRGQETPVICGIVVVGADQLHRLHVSSEPATLIYIDGSSAVGAGVRSQLGSDAYYCPDLAQTKLIRMMIAENSNIPRSRLAALVASRLWRAAADVEQDIIDPRVREILTRLDELQYLPRSISPFAQLVGLSGSRLRHLFKEQVGMSPSKYLLWLKLQRAVRYLDKERSLTGAAYAGGFSDSAHLARTFRGTFGISPSDLTKHGSVELEMELG